MYVTTYDRSGRVTALAGLGRVLVVLNPDSLKCSGHFGQALVYLLKTNLDLISSISSNLKLVDTSLALILALSFPLV